MFCDSLTPFCCYCCCCVYQTNGFAAGISARFKNGRSFATQSQRWDVPGPAPPNKGEAEATNGCWALGDDDETFPPLCQEGNVACDWRSVGCCSIGDRASIPHSSRYCVLNRCIVNQPLTDVPNPLVFFPHRVHLFKVHVDLHSLGAEYIGKQSPENRKRMRRERFTLPRY